MQLGRKPEKHKDVYDAISPAILSGCVDGKVAIITGASRGIGRAIALALAEAGADVALVARTKSQLEDVANIVISEHGRKALVCIADATDEDAMAAVFQNVERELGKVDIAVANAGINVFRPFAYTPFKDVWRVMEVNTKGPLLLAQLAVNAMRERRQGTIIVISSYAGVNNLPGIVGYSASKSAVLRALACLQLELDAEGMSGIQTFGLHPGSVGTEMSIGPDAVHPDLNKLTPGYYDRIKNIFSTFDDAPELCAWTCVYLASGKAKELRGRYVDVTDNVEEIANQADIVKKENLYDLVVRRLGDNHLPISK